MDRKKAGRAALAAGVVAAGVLAVRKTKKGECLCEGCACCRKAGQTDRSEGEAPQEPQTVLITGAMGGIGRELAEEFASHGFDLVLAARNAGKLDRICSVQSEAVQPRT